MKTHFSFSILNVFLIVSILIILQPIIISASNDEGLVRSKDIPFSLFKNDDDKNDKVCQLTLIDLPTVGTDEDDHIYVCNVVSDEGITDYFLLVTFPKNLHNVIERNTMRLASQQWFMQYTEDDITVLDTGIESITYNNQKNALRREHLKSVRAFLETIPQNANRYRRLEQQQRQLLRGQQQQQQQPNHQDRQLASLGDKTLVVVLVGDVSVRITDVYKHIFNDKDSLAAQLSGCSHSQLNIVPHPDNPIIRMETTNHISNYDFSSIFIDSLPKVGSSMGSSWRSGLRSKSDYYLYIVPDDISRLPDEVGWAPVNGYYSLIIESWMDSVQTLMHEIGHNLGNNHAFDNGAEYGDLTSVMGSAQRITNVCFNGQNYWHMEWFMDRRINIKSIDDDESRIIKLAFEGDYDKTTVNDNTQEYVVVKIYDDIYLTYNRKKGFNKDVPEYADMLLIAQEKLDDIYPYSDLVYKTKTIGDYFVFDNYDGIADNDVVIELCDITMGDDRTTPDYLTVSISKKIGGCK